MNKNIEAKHYAKALLFFAPLLTSKQVSEILKSSGHIISPAAVAGIKSRIIGISGKIPGENEEVTYKYIQQCDKQRMRIEIKCSIKR